MKRKVVLCGSMKVKEEIFKVQKELEDKGFEVYIPEESLIDMSKDEASRRHFKKIIDNDIVVVVNACKKGIENYIGPNSFAEVAFGFYFKKKVYLLYDYYEPYREELEGWGVVPLKGNLDGIE